MRCPEHPPLERRVEGFERVAFLVPPSSGGACLMAVGHDYYQKAPIKINISHGRVCIFMLGVLLSAGGVNSDSIRVFNPTAEMLSGLLNLDRKMAYSIIRA
ncbi:hypothetical protein M9H77_35646 [Catharanthus roseus]|uniref:Uncharacterized protein n=1 Tax=Catharanthus roseus TaxID=4058 RepID=A0ACB9ZPK9_CATRO|nr:hypothetical protein M9H77_35646 [Catharanthus roseus]